jgi:hypothetical protein
MRSHNTTNPIGQTFGRLLVLATPPYGKGERQLWECMCQCGNYVTVVAKNARKGHTKSCGCLRRDANTTHGGSGLPEYAVWEAMIGRCFNANHPQFNDYGGRGITVCEQWRNFATFYQDMGARPTSNHSIDRINNEGNYEPTNCRWTTVDKQSRNKRNNHFLTLNGVTMCLSDWAQRGNISPGLLSYRIRIQKMSLTQALSTPPKPYKLRIRSPSCEG